MPVQMTERQYQEFLNASGRTNTGTEAFPHLQSQHERGAENANIVAGGVGGISTGSIVTGVLAASPTLRFGFLLLSFAVCLLGAALMTYGKVTDVPTPPYIPTPGNMVNLESSVSSGHTIGVIGCGLLAMGILMIGRWMVSTVFGWIGRVIYHDWKPARSHSHRMRPAKRRRRQ